MDQPTTTTGNGIRANGGNISLWILQIVLGGLFIINFGPGKLLGSEQSVELFADIGAGQWLRYVTGTLEVAGGLGLLIPRLSGLAALGLTGVMGGAALTDMVIVDESPIAPLILLIAAAVIAWFRRDRSLAVLQQLRARRSPARS
ncbi:DoxX family protein [Streptomyces pseudovenezuelae]|uniref:Oxidoreductase n=1 Tax=Streptomyces pseudovenezuelae TaxID=67350 RepID=A0ABT6M0M9_9ACTN|nr:DoxX family protein [Streptomyces pseudovenezuelae]MDH6221614.1 putative oxidoreductase [Streptomyces pseudovenezuelae]